MLSQIREPGGEHQGDFMEEEAQEGTCGVSQVSGLERKNVDLNQKEREKGRESGRQDWYSGQANMGTKETDHTAPGAVGGVQSD